MLKKAKIGSATLVLAVLVSFGLVFCGQKSGESRNEWEVVIIGAGAGGLGAGATLAQAGVKTLILEQHDKPGGYMTAFERGDYRFEVSLHMMDGLDEGGATREFFEQWGILDRVKPIKLESLYRAIYPDFSFDVPAELGEYEKKLKDQFPENTDDISGLLGELKGIAEDLMGLMQIEKEFFLLRWLKLPLIPVLYWDFIKNRNVTLGEIADRSAQDPRIKALVLQLHTFLGLPPSQASGGYFSIMWGSYHYNGAYHFEGGSQAVSNALAEVIREEGGEVRLNTKVEKIIVRDGKAVGVRVEGGEEIFADYVISNASANQTYLELVGEEHLKPKFVEYVNGLEPGISITEVYIGSNLDLEEIGLGDVGEIFYSPNYDYEDHWKQIREMNLEKMPLAAAFYSNTDPTCAPPGKSVIVLTIMAPYDWQNRWKMDEGYEAYTALKEEVAEKMIAIAEREFIPGLKDSIEEIEIGTPLTLERYTLNSQGAFMGWAPSPDQSMLKRMKQKSPVKNLYLAGSWTFPGGGQSASMISGDMTARKILKRR